MSSPYSQRHAAGTLPAPRGGSAQLLDCRLTASAARACPGGHLRRVAAPPDQESWPLDFLRRTSPLPPTPSSLYQQHLLTVSSFQDMRWSGKRTPTRLRDIPPKLSWHRWARTYMYVHVKRRICSRRLGPSNFSFTPLPFSTVFYVYTQYLPYIVLPYSSVTGEPD